MNRIMPLLIVTLLVAIGSFGWSRVGQTTGPEREIKLAAAMSPDCVKGKVTMTLAIGGKPVEILPLQLRGDISRTMQMVGQYGPQLPKGYLARKLSGDGELFMRDFGQSGQVDYFAALWVNDAGELQAFACPNPPQVAAK